MRIGCCIAEESKDDNTPKAANDGWSVVSDFWSAGADIFGCKTGDVVDWTVVARV